MYMDSIHQGLINWNRINCEKNANQILHEPHHTNENKSKGHKLLHSDFAVIFTQVSIHLVKPTLHNLSTLETHKFSWICRHKCDPMEQCSGSTFTSLELHVIQHAVSHSGLQPLSTPPLFQLPQHLTSHVTGVQQAFCHRLQQAGKVKSFSVTSYWSHDIPLSVKSASWK